MDAHPDSHPGPAICGAACFVVAEAAWVLFTIQQLVQDWHALSSCPLGGLAAGGMMVAALPTPFVTLYMCACVYQSQFVEPWLALDAASGVYLVLSLPTWGNLPAICGMAGKVGEPTHGIIAVDAAAAALYLCVRAAAIRRKQQLRAAIKPFTTDGAPRPAAQLYPVDPTGYADL